MAAGTVKLIKYISLFTLVDTFYAAEIMVLVNIDLQKTFMHFKIFKMADIFLKWPPYGLKMSVFASCLITWLFVHNRDTLYFPKTIIFINICFKDTFRMKFSFGISNMTDLFPKWPP